MTHRNRILNNPTSFQCEFFSKFKLTCLMEDITLNTKREKNNTLNDKY